VRPDHIGLTDGIKRRSRQNPINKTNFMESRLESTSPPDGLQVEATDKIANELKALIQRVEKKSVEGVKVADRVVRDHPYETIGIAFGLGVLIGILVRRK
jgi:hypothetical protein